jgi:hypothetical protein
MVSRGSTGRAAGADAKWAARHVGTLHSHETALTGKSAVRIPSPRSPLDVNTESDISFTFRERGSTMRRILVLAQTFAFVTVAWAGPAPAQAQGHTVSASSACASHVQITGKKVAIRDEAKPSAPVVAFVREGEVLVRQPHFAT